MFQKYTAPVPPPKPEKPKPHVKFGARIIQITEEGLQNIVDALRHASHVHLWHDPSTSEVAITPAPADDKDAFSIKNGKVQAKKFFDHFHIAAPIKNHSATLQPHEDGVKVSIGTGKPVTRRASGQATPDPKPSQKKKWEPGDPIPARGRKSEAQKAWIAEHANKA